MLEDGMTMPAKAEKLGSHSFSLIIKEGRKHQIRRMCDFLHLTVVQLKRIRVGNIKLGGMKAGESRPISQKDIDLLKKSARE